MEAQRREVPEAIGHLKLQVQHAKNKETEESNQGGNELGKSNEDQATSEKYYVVWLRTATKRSPLSRPRGSPRGLQAAKVAAGSIKTALGSGRIIWFSPCLLL